MIRPSLFVSLLIVAALAHTTTAFAPATQFARTQLSRPNVATSINMGFGMGDEPPKKLTRENEPEEYFTSEMDKMSDAEKLPIALAGLAGISLPFIAGLIFLYASK